MKAKQNLLNRELDKDLKQRLAESDLVPPSGGRDWTKHKFKHHTAPEALADQVLHLHFYEGEELEAIAKRLDLDKSDVLRILEEAGAM